MPCSHTDIQREERERIQERKESESLLPTSSHSVTIAFDFPFPSSFFSLSNSFPSLPDSMMQMKRREKGKRYML